jgi:hypothetical protein
VNTKATKASHAALTAAFSATGDLFSARPPTVDPFPPFPPPTALRCRHGGFYSSMPQVAILAGRRAAHSHHQARIVVLDFFRSSAKVRF